MNLLISIIFTAAMAAAISPPKNVRVDGLPTPTPVPPIAGTAGPLSGYPWWSGHWVNGDSNRNADFENWRNMPADAVTQGMRGIQYYYEQAGCSSENQCLLEFRQTRANFSPSYDGVFGGTAWMGHVWGSYPATDHRKKLIHLAWMDTIPSSVGNGSGKNPKLWYDIKSGAADRYMFLLGRKFAALDEKYGDPAYPMSFDFTYEWTLQTHPQWPSGTYTLNGVVQETFRDFPYGWSRMVRVFKEGYRYQRGKVCSYRFSWRPQLAYSVRDKNNQIVRHDAMWPNDVSDWNITQDVVIDGVVVLPKGPIGRQADILSVSWHDSSKVQVQGKTYATGNWKSILDGFSTHWGLNEVSAFARAKGVKMVFPEWAARRDTHPPASLYPGDVYRFTHWFFSQNKDVLAYETVFDQGSGTLDTTWVPAQPADQEPGPIYLGLWHR